MNNPIPSLNSEPLQQLGQKLLHSEQLAKWLGLFFLLIILYILSQITWTVWELFQPRETIQIQAIKTSPTTNKQINIQQVARYNLFGDKKAVVETPVSETIDAPITRLKLKLRGVYAAKDEKLASAMIEAQNKQEIYIVGSNLPGAAGLKLHKVMADRVIMSRGGKYETLMIEDFAQGGGRSNNIIRPSTPNRRNTTMTNVVQETDDQSSTTPDTIDKRNDENLAVEVGKLRDKLSDPQSLSELVNVTPAMVQDEFQGFRLSPGKNRALFGRLGLRRNDILTAVNGIDLSDPSSAFSLMQQLQSADEINLSIKRGSREMNVIFNSKAQQ